MIHLLAQTLPLPSDVDSFIGGTIALESTVTQGISDLVASVSPSIMAFGWMLLGVFGGIALLQTLLQGAIRQMVSHHVHPLALVLPYVAVLFRIVSCVVMMTFYSVPLPGVSFSFHQMFPTLGNALSAAVTTDLLKQTLGDFNYAIQFLPAVGMFQIWPAVVATLVMILIALGQIGMTVITAGAYCIIGVLTVCGPIMIPFYALPGEDKRFWSWLDNMIVYSMYGFIGSCFIFIFCHSYLDFFGKLQSWGIGAWSAHIPYLIVLTVVFLWTMFKVPQIAHLIFGGVGGVISGFAGMIQSLVTLGVGKLLA